MDGSTPEPLTSAESLGVLVAGALHAVEVERDQARVIATTLEQQLAEAARHLTAVLTVCASLGTTFAADSRIVSQANEYLEGLQSTETPEEGTTT